jgi:hypothetical protein
MAFNYQTLKRLTNTSLDGATVAAADLGTNSVTNAKLANGSVTATKMAASAVNLGSSTVTGTLPFAKGGTSNTAAGGAYQALTTNSANNALTFAQTGIRGMSVYTSTGTWSRPTGVRYIMVQVQGGGGGGSGHGESGAAGGYSERILDVTGISSVTCTIAGGGGGTYYSNAGGNGSGSSFGPYLSATGGHGANRHNQHNGGLAGVGSGGDLNIYGGCGGSHEQRSAGMGGASFFGGPGPSGHPQGGHFAHNHQGHSSPGTGGTSGYFSGHRGADGRPGLIIVTEFY